MLLCNGEGGRDMRSSIRAHSLIVTYIVHPLIPDMQ